MDPWAFLLVIVIAIQLAFAEPENAVITIFAEDNLKGERMPAPLGNCMSVNLPQGLRYKVPRISSIDPNGQCLRLWEFECCQGRFRNIEPESLQLLLKLHEPIKGDGNWFDPRSISTCDPLAVPNAPEYLEDPTLMTWMEVMMDNTNVKGFQDRNSAVYLSYEQNLSDESKIDWLYNIVSFGWGYIKRTYGAFGKEGRLYAIFHGDNKNKYATDSRAARYYDSMGECRNILNIHASRKDENATARAEKRDLDTITRLMSEVVDDSFNQTFGSPMTKWWRANQAFADIFRYDLYRRLNMTKDAERIKSEAANRKTMLFDQETTWFDWFLTIYENCGETRFLQRFFQLRQQFFTKEVHFKYGNIFTRYMNFGEYIHFTSGAANTSAIRLANYVFNMNEDRRNEFYQAQKDFKQFTYNNYDW